MIGGAMLVVMIVELNKVKEILVKDEAAITEAQKRV